MEIATPEGSLAILPPGKTIVTIGLKHLRRKNATYPWVENKHTEQQHHARREFKALSHARGHAPGGKRLGRRIDQNSRSPHCAASPSGTPRHMQRGHSLVDTWSNRGEQVKRGLKRKDPALVWTVGKNQAKRTAKNAYKRVSESWRALEDFSKRKIAFDVTRPKDSSFRLIKLVGPSLASSRWRAIPCCTRPRDSPPPPHWKMANGTIFGKSERMRYPLMRTSSQLDH